MIAFIVSRFMRTVFLAWMVLLSLPALWKVDASEFPDPNEAFRLEAELRDSGSITLHWTIAEGCKLYREQVDVSVEDGALVLGELVFPKGTMFADPLTGGKSEIYHDTLFLTLPLVSVSEPFTLNVTYQGCAEGGLCYPPVTEKFLVDPQQPGPLVTENTDGVLSKAVSLNTATESSRGISSPEQGSFFSTALEEGSLWKISLMFLFFGLLLSFTPCILPMVPILSSIIVGEGSVTRLRGFLLALVYSLGMATVYTLLGVLAGLAGEGLAGFLQRPEVLGIFSVLLVVLALSMFDVYQIQMPSTLQTRLTGTSRIMKGGRFPAVFFMGAISALVVGPCVAAPLAGTLVYISQTKNVVTGGLALFSMASGMSVPLLLVGLSAGYLLPRAGAWMTGVKYFFGFLLIAVAIWIVTPVLPMWAVLLAWGFFALLCSVFLGVFENTAGQPTAGARFRKALGVLFLIVGVLELAGAASGGRSVFEPLSGISRGPKMHTEAENPLRFTMIHSVEELDRALESSQRPVMLDFYADWCVSCKELEHLTFSDPRVVEKLENISLLKADVTANTEEERALMKRFSIFGPPGIVFFDSSGREIPESRIAGFINTANFIEHIERFIGQ
ncbi:protein-disulfide reductase DsbD [Prosthecochloris sp. SCSIO W1103]|uniref:protein-disulfide reductase DsbD n=1 Tax=Prosthecochloris sp. SCSIO W1103 TaxID=2992244 RepID=UPI00223D2E44|nr:protein-disulfide reductase DsbD [Prosthecochloris sp. SCSIO W1103]UZJ38659.1 protein-disulfide reductase DsbD [Prosthecochloris sp. SCSIO W1103]